MSSTVQKHVLDHVKEFVEENPRMIGGVPCSPTAFGGAKGEYSPLARRGRYAFYVCPRTGLLRDARRARKAR